MSTAELDHHGGGGGSGGTTGVPGDARGVQRGASVFVSVCNLANCAIGAGVLSVPFAVREMGAALGLALAATVAAMIIFTLNTLLRAGERHGAVSYQDLVLKALGPAASHVVSLTLIVYIFGSCVAYTVIIADSFTAVLEASLARSHRGGGGEADAPSPWASREGVILAAAACVLLPLSLLRRTKSLAPASTLAVAALLYTTAVVVVKGCMHISAAGAGGGPVTEDDDGGDGGGGGNSSGAAGPASGPTPGGGGGGGHGSWRSGTFRLGGRGYDLWRFDEGTVLALPILVFAFQCHIQVISIFAELRDEPGEGGADAHARGEGAGVGAGIAGHAHAHLDYQQGVSPSSSTSSLSMLLSPSPSLASTSSRVVVDGGGGGGASGRAGAGAGVGGGHMQADGSDGGSRHVRGRKVRATSRRRATMERVVAIAILMCLVGYILVGEFAYLTHPDVQSNMLNSYGMSDPWILAASASMGLSAVGSYPINHFSSRAALDDMLSAALGWRAAAPGMAPARRHVSQTMVFLALTTAVSLQVTDLGVVFQLVGSTAGVLVIFLVPALLLLQPAPPPPGSSAGSGAGAGDGSHGGALRGSSSNTRGDGDGDDGAGGGEDDDVVGVVGPRVRRHWTEGGGSFGGYDELGALGGDGGTSVAAFRDMSHDDMRAALLPERCRDGDDGPGNGGDVEGGEGGEVVSRRRVSGGGGGGGVSVADAVRGYALLLLGVLISTSNIYLLFFADTAVGHTPNQFPGTNSTEQHTPPARP